MNNKGVLYELDQLIDANVTIKGVIYELDQLIETLNDLQKETMDEPQYKDIGIAKM